MPEMIRTKYLFWKYLCKISEKKELAGTILRIYHITNNLNKNKRIVHSVLNEKSLPKGERDG